MQNNSLLFKIILKYCLLDNHCYENPQFKWPLSENLSCLTYLFKYCSRQDKGGANKMKRKDNNDLRRLRRHEIVLFLSQKCSLL